MACETAGVGVKPPARSIITSTSLAASTSSAVLNAGSDMGIPAQEERALDPLRAAVKADRLADGQDVLLVVAPLEW